MLTISAPILSAYRIAATEAAMVGPKLPTLSGIRLVSGPTPITPTPLSPAAAIVPPVWVPCPR
jgi:hypothetical protein